MKATLYDYIRYALASIGAAIMFLAGGFVGASLVNPYEVTFGARTGISDFLIVHIPALLFPVIFLWFIVRLLKDELLWIAGGGAVIILLTLSIVWA